MKLLRTGALSLCAGVVVVLYACTNPEMRQVTAPSPTMPRVSDLDCDKSVESVPLRSNSDLEKVLGYAAGLGHLSAAQLHEQHRITKARLAANPANDVERFRLALLLMHSPGEFKDLKVASTLLEDYLKRNDKEFLLNSFAALLTVIIKDHANISERESALERKLALSDKNLKLLQSQLDALKSIETSIHRRDLTEGQQ